MDQPTFVYVTPDELATTLRVWLRTMPKHLWRPYEQMLAAAGSRRIGADDRVDPADVIAAYMVEKFAQTRWRACYEAPDATHITVRTNLCEGEIKHVLGPPPVEPLAQARD
jgi:hypothetical protein